MNSTKHEYKLNHKLILSAIIAFFISGLLFFVLQHVAYHFIKIYCENPKVVSSHLEQKADSLQQYISTENIQLTDLSQLDVWEKGNALTEVAIYHGKKQVYSSSPTLPELSIRINADSEKDILAWNNGYILTFQDGDAVAFIHDQFQHRFRDYAIYINLTLFFVCFITIMIVFIRKKVSKINTLVQEIRILEGGNLYYPITVVGNDELSSLAQEVDDMRKAFIVREQYAGRVAAASNELMTGISHDLRTPLTALIGYLEIMEEEACPAGESPFLGKCKNRAFQIKGLVNNLFEYFFAATTEQLQFHPKIRSVKEALQEIIKEHICLIEQSGFTVINEIELPNADMLTEKAMVQRLFDNLFSNIKKYADPEFPVRFHSVIEKEMFLLTISNRIYTSSEEKGTGIGLKTCEKIMSLHHGSLLYNEQKDIYTLYLRFPIK
ncbi:HAMP domain-containing sensor histidine kinase [Anaerotignum sp.]|uniref:HAMP domain-containing sensor histidine kinase n=1 Tax=Anaerotignum sp. TaxID=2039241 RepID=UPI0028B0F28B|nr:HAMP domain-containing sensor histidine kinase [Anaerotignum sp.]